ncbi:MAG: hypothetical protein ACUVUC_15395 [Thermoguttaceae bacterium]
MAATRSFWKSWLVWTLCLGSCWAQQLGSAATQELVRIRACADVWLSDAGPRQRRSSAGKAPFLKLRGVQDLALIRFDLSGIRGREVLAGTLFLHRAGPDMLRYVRVSTVNQDWREGEIARPYGPPDGATFSMADASPQKSRPWAWPGSTVADVIMSSGNSLGCWAERKELDDGWIAVELTPALIYAMAVGDSDGLAVMDGGNPANHENLISSVQDAGFEPYLEVQLGGALPGIARAPLVSAVPAPERAGLESGAIRIQIEPLENIFCWRVLLDGKPVDRWQIPHPVPGQPTIFYLEDLPPDKEFRIDVVGVSSAGAASPPARLTAISSPTLARGPELDPLEPPATADIAPKEAGPIQVWALPGLVKISPTAADPMANDLGNVRVGTRADTTVNAVWDGRQVYLFGGRGEYVSFQLCVQTLENAPPTSIQVRTQPFSGPDSQQIGPENVELYWNWYARNQRGQWQPAYCIPIEPGSPLAIRPSDRRFPEQRNQTLYVDVYIPKEADPGLYRGSVVLTDGQRHQIEVPVVLEVFSFVIPDRLSFWPELNGYHIPDGAIAYYRLAHQHRCVLNCMAWRPGLSGRGRQIKVHWEQYDRTVGPLLTGEAFAGNRRSGVPVECMYLPFDASWPTPLEPETYHYPGYWPRQGDDLAAIVQHYLTGPYIADGLSREYQEALVAVQQQFIEHFQQKGYTQTEMQCCFVGKATNRIEYGSNVWWTTDEPQYWDDWLALRFFLHLWTRGRGQADPRQWTARADISRPQWQGRTLAGLVDAAYFGAGGFSSPAMVRRCRLLAQQTGISVRAYGSASPDEFSNLENVTTLLAAWLDGADAFLVWQSLGSDKALDLNDAGAEGGAALLVPAARFGLPVVADMRLKALRDGQQLIEYLTLLADRHRLSRDQIKAMLCDVLRGQNRARTPRPEADATAVELGTLSAWELCQLRRRLAELLEPKRG